MNPPSAFDSKAFRQALSTFMTGVTIVTTLDEQARKRGFTANSFTSLSLHPPLILVCIAKNAEAVDVFTHCAGFAVNVLAEQQQALSTTFATKEPNKFDTVRVRAGRSGAPLLDGCLGWFDCTPYQQVEAGDHIILIGEVQDFGLANGNPLGYWRSGYVTLGRESTAARVDHSLATHVGCIIGWQGKVVLQQAPSALAASNPPLTPTVWQLPATLVDGRALGHDERLAKLLAELGLHANVDFLYSVFETSDSGENYIFYRGSLLRAQDRVALAAHRLSLFDQTELPWSALPNAETKIMLQRYFRESSVDSFGIYTDARGGSVARLAGQPRDWQPTSG